MSKLQSASREPGAACQMRSAHRKKRPRRPVVGMMLHQDAWTQAWLPGNPRPYDLVVTMEDAAGARYLDCRMDEASTASSLQALREVVDKHGLCGSLSSDRGHDFFIPNAGGQASKTTLTPVGQALSRLTKAFRLAGVATVKAASRGLRDSFIADANTRFAIQAEQVGLVCVAEPSEAWWEILCVQEDRAVGQDNTVKWDAMSLHLPASRLRLHCVRTTIKVPA